MQVNKYQDFLVKKSTLTTAHSEVVRHMQNHSPIIFNGRVARVLVAPTTIFHVSKAGPNVTFIKTGKEISLTKLTSTRRLWYQVIRNLSSELVTKKPT